MPAATPEQIADALTAMRPYGVTAANIERFARDVDEAVKAWGLEPDDLMGSVFGMSAALGNAGRPTPAPTILAGILAIQRDAPWRSWKCLSSAYAQCRYNGIGHDAIVFALALSDP